MCCAGAALQWRCESCAKVSEGFAFPYGRCPHCGGRLEAAADRFGDARVHRLLARIDDASENSFVQSNITADAWIGATTCAADTPVVISADKAVKYESVVKVMDTLQRAGVQPRQTVAIMLPTSPEYFGTYFGILRAGAVPVPIYPPARPSQLEDHVLRHTGILANAQAVLLVSVPEAMVVARLLQARVPGLHRVVTPADLAGSAGRPQPVLVRPVEGLQVGALSQVREQQEALRHIGLDHCRRVQACVAQQLRDMHEGPNVLPVRGGIHDDQRPRRPGVRRAAARDRGV